MAVQKHKKPEQKTQNRKQSTGRQHSLPGKRKQAQKKQTTGTQKDKNGKTKTKEEKSGKDTPAGRKADLRPYTPYKNGRRGDRTATAESTESGRQKQNPGKTKKRNVQKSRMQKTSVLRKTVARKIFSGEGGMCRHTGYKDHAGRTDVRAIQATRAARATKPAHATRNTKPEQTTRVSRTTPDLASLAERFREFFAAKAEYFIDKREKMLYNRRN